MNKRMRIASCFGIFTASVVFLGAAHADLISNFTVPPYKLNASVIGIEGWEPRLAGASDDEISARVVAVRWDNDQPALLLDGASIRRGFEETMGTRVKVTATLAITYPSNSRLQTFRISITGAPFKEIVFDGQAGLGFGDGSGRNTEVAIPIEQVKPNSYYTYSILVDYDNSTYDLEITGEKRDGSPLSYQNKGVAFVSKDTSMKSVFIISSKYIRAYLKGISVESL